MNKWIEITDISPMPKKGDRVLIVLDFSKWDKKRNRRIEIANVGFFEKTMCIGGPNSLTGYADIKGLYFSIPAILHPDCVTHWMPLMELPLPAGELPF